MIRLSNDNNEEFSLVVNKYVIDSQNNLFDSDWLEADISFKNGIDIFNFRLSFLLVEDLERIKQWAQSNTTEDLLFTDPQLVFSRAYENDITVIKIIFEHENMFRVFAINQTEKIVNRFINMTERELNRFPCRCGLKHEI